MTFEETEKLFYAGLDYIFSNPDGRTVLPPTGLELRGHVEKWGDPCYPLVTLSYRGKEVKTYSKNTGYGYHFTEKDYAALKKLGFK